MAQFNITPRAKEDLRGIWCYTFEVWGEAQADQYVSALYDRFGWLAQQPQIGKHRPDICEGYYCFLHQKHLVFYLRYERHIDIIGVLHQSMDIIEYFNDE